MLQAALAGLLTAAMMTSVVVLTKVVSPNQALHRLTPVVVGTLDLNSEPASATFDVSNMAPGDVVAHALEITNSGTLPFRYAMSTKADDDPAGLARALTIAIHAAVGGSCAEDGGAVIAGRSAPAELAFGSAAWGAQPGDRRLDAGARELICYVVELPLSASNAVSGAVASLTFTFHAEEIRDE